MATIREQGDAPADLSTQPTASAGDVFEGSLASRQDSDWVRVPVEAGAGYVFSVQGDGTPEGVEGATVTVRDALGVQLDSGSARVGVAVAEVSPLSDGIVYASVSPYIYGSIGRYQLSIEREVARGLGTTTDLAIGEELRGEIGFRGDSDWVRVDLDAGTGYVIRVEGDGSPFGITTAQVAIRDALGAPINAYISSGSGIVRAVTPAWDQTIYVDIGTGSFSGSLGRYVLSVTPEVGFGPATGADIALGETLRSRIDFSGDGDWYRFDAQAGQSYVVETLGDGSATSLGAHSLRFHDPRGEQIASLVSLDPSGSLTVTAQETGGHYVSIAASSGAGRAGLGYELSLRRDAIEGGDALDDVLDGTPGDDLLSGLGGDDLLRGGEGSDRLDGGQGVDTLEGGAGDDVLIVSDPRDVVRGGSGVDEVRTSVSFAMSGGESIERLIATGGAPLRLLGDAGDQALIGNGAANVLAGLGGDDTITGGAGRDTFVLLAVEGRSRASVTDFSQAEGDRIAIDDRLLGAGSEAFDPRGLGIGEAFALLRRGVVDYDRGEGALTIDGRGGSFGETSLHLDPEIRLELGDVLLF